MTALGGLERARRKSGLRFLGAAAGSIMLLACWGCFSAQGRFSFVEDEEQGILTIRDGEKDVLTYRFGEQLGAEAPDRYVRSCYIHPLYSLGGEVITQDFPPDHLHHHGVFWTWPVVRVRGRQTQTWHPDALRQYFVRWLKRETAGGTVVLGIENAWKLDGETIVAEETVTILVHPAEEAGRAVDLEIVLSAVGGPLELGGAPEGDKGYGGLCLRGAPMFTGSFLTTDLGPQEEDSVNVRFRWADLSTPDFGVAIFVSPGHPGYPTTWLVRTSYAGVLNPSWPGLQPAVLLPDQPVALSYRLYIHRGDVTAGRVREAFAAFLSGR